MKIFGVGLSRTGTTSLNDALWMLGYRSEHYFYDLDRIHELDGATDTPIARAYPELDRRHPGSKFILTERDLGDWLDSCRRFFVFEPDRGATRKLHLDLYDSLNFHEGKWAHAYRRHSREVRRYFRRRPQDLLVMDVCAGDGWERLCPFLGRSRPDVAFPHLNRRGER